MRNYLQLVQRIQKLPESARAAIAAGSAQRLMDHHLNLPATDRDPFIAALAPDLDKLRGALLAPSADADKALRRLLKKHRSESYADQIGKNDWPRGDDHVFAAAMNALEAYCHRDAESGSSAAMRLIDAASDMAGNDL
jgi:hypothetical protein